MNGHITNYLLCLKNTRVTLEQKIKDAHDLPKDIVGILVDYCHWTSGMGRALKLLVDMRVLFYIPITHFDECETVIGFYQYSCSIIRKKRTSLWEFLIDKNTSPLSGDFYDLIISKIKKTEEEMLQYPEILELLI